MTQSKEDWVKSPWTISIGTAIFSFLLTIGYDYLKEKPILSTIWSIFKWIGNMVWKVLNFDLKIWWLIIIFGLFILTIVIIDKFKNEETLKPDFCSYKEDTLKKWRWTWSWKLDNRKNAWIITDMKAHCPKCATPMIEYSNRYQLSFDCPRCEFRASDAECDEPYKIERIILDNIDRKRS